MCHGSQTTFAAKQVHKYSHESRVLLRPSTSGTTARAVTHWLTGGYQHGCYRSAMVARWPGDL